MQPALSSERQHSSALPVLYWDGSSPMALIGQVEAHLAAGTCFVVLAQAAPWGRGADRGFLAGWWRTARPRLAGLCAGWAVVGEAPAAGPVRDLPEFPVRRCADRVEALWWLRSRLAGRPWASIALP